MAAVRQSGYSSRAARPPARASFADWRCCGGDARERPMRQMAPPCFQLETGWHPRMPPSHHTDCSTVLPQMKMKEDKRGKEEETRGRRDSQSVLRVFVIAHPAALSVRSLMDGCPLLHIFHLVYTWTVVVGGVPGRRPATWSQAPKERFVSTHPCRPPVHHLLVVDSNHQQMRKVPPPYDGRKLKSVQYRYHGMPGTRVSSYHGMRGS